MNQLVLVIFVVAVSFRVPKTKEESDVMEFSPKYAAGTNAVLGMLLYWVCYQIVLVYEVACLAFTLLYIILCHL